MNFYKPRELFKGLSNDDVHRYYARCLLPIRNAKTREIKVRWIDEMDKRYARVFRGCGGQEALLLKEYELPLGWNINCYINHKKFATHLARMPKRQWRKGLNRHNMNIMIPFEEVLHEYYVNYHEMQVAKNDTLLFISPLQELFDKGWDGYYPNYKDAYNKIAKGEAGSVAVDRHYAIAVDDRAAEPYILRYNNVIGRAFPDHVVLDTDFRHLWPQLNFTEVRGKV